VGKRGTSVLSRDLYWAPPVLAADMSAETMMRIYCHDFVAKTELDLSRASPVFVHDGKRQRGLTRLLATEFPVSHERAKCPGCQRKKRSRSMRTRCGLNQPGASSRKRKLPSGKHALSTNVAGVSSCHGQSDADHGSQIDDELTAIFNGEELETMDPCTLSLLNLFERKKWTMVATQLPIYIPLFECATAIDVLLRDEHGALVLCEVKTTKHPGTDPAVAKQCYTFSTTSKRGLLCSWYHRNQLQLYAMLDALHQTGAEVPHACVVRTTPSYAEIYPHNPQIESYFTAAADEEANE